MNGGILFRLILSGIAAFLLIWNYFLRSILKISFLENLSFFGFENKIIILIIGVGLLALSVILNFRGSHNQK